MRRKLKEYTARLLCICIFTASLPLIPSVPSQVWGSTGACQGQWATPGDAHDDDEDIPDWEKDGDLYNDLATGSDASETEKNEPDKELKELTKNDLEEDLATASNATKGFYHKYQDESGVSVILTAEPGVLPEDTEVQIRQAGYPEKGGMADQILKDSREILTEIFAFDIAFFQNGEEFQPEKDSVQITFDLSGLYGGKSTSRMEIFHIAENADQENEDRLEIMETEISEKQRVSCAASSFSVYGVAVIGRSEDFIISGTTLLKYAGAEKRVVIPDGIEIVGSASFEGNKTVEEIIIPDSVMGIQDKAFADTANLRAITIGSGVFFVSYDMIVWTPKLETINVSQQNQHLYVENGILRERNSTSIQFYPGGKKDKRFVIPEGVKSMDFNKNAYIEEIYISRDVEQINLDYTMSLKNITVDENNSHFCVVDDVLYNYDKTRIVRYPSAKKGSRFFVPESVQILGDEQGNEVFPSKGELKEICFPGNCPRDPDEISSSSWRDWSSAFEAENHHVLYYYDGNESWEEFEKAYADLDGFRRYLDFDLHPIVRGFSICAEKNQVVVANPLQLVVVKNDIANGMIMSPVIPGYWKTENDSYSVSKEGVFTGTVAGRTVVQAGGGELSETVEIQIEVLQNPDQHRKISTSQEWEVLKLTNRERMARGVAPLAMCEGLQSVTDVRKRELEKKYSHDRPNGSDCFSVVEEKGLHFGALGENIAAGFSNPESVVAGWMDSPGHRENILNPEFTHMGAGYTKGGEQFSPSWVQMFLGTCKWSEGVFIDKSVKYKLKKGKRIDSLDIPVITYCSGHGISYLPLIEEMCSGLDSDVLGTQKVMVTCGEFKAGIEIEIISGSSSSGTSGSSGSSGGGGGGGGGGGTSSRGGVVNAGGPGAANGSLPSYVVKGTWAQQVDGRWTFADDAGNGYRNRWAAVYNPYANVEAGVRSYDWFRFDENGFMMTGWFTDPADQNLYYLNPVSDGTCGRMVTGWATIDGKEYCFNPVSDGTMGRMLRSTATGDGHFVGADGTKVY